MSHKIVERGGKRYVLVPKSTYERMLDSLDDLDDIRLYDRAKAQAQEFVPSEIVKRLIARENPLKIWREYRGLTQQALADASGISKPYLSQLENGARTASVKVLGKLARKLAVDIDDLIGR